MGKSSSSKKRSRAADEDAVDGAAPEAVTPVVKKSKIDVNGKAEVTKNGVDDTPSKKDKKGNKKDKPDKKEKKDKKKEQDNAEAEVNGEKDSTPKEKKGKKDKKKKSKSKDADNEDVAMQDATPAVNGDSADADAEVNGYSNKKKSKKDKKDKNDKKEKKSKKYSSEPQPDQQDEAADPEEEDDGAQEKSSSKSTRFICFVGNLPYTATADAVRAHFSSIQPTSVRLLTHKEEPSKSRGTAFVEFGRYDHMKTCLEKFHHTEFNDGISPARKINVELTAGGGGKTPHRLEKIKAKNEKLKEERAQRMAKEEAAKQEKDAVNKVQPAAQQPEQNVAGWIHPSRLGRVPHEQQTQEQRDQDPNQNEQPAKQWDGSGGKFHSKRFAGRSRGGGGGGGGRGGGGRGRGRGGRGKFRGRGN